MSMKRYLIYIIASFLMMVSCTSKQDIPTKGQATVAVQSLTRSGSSGTAAIDEDLAITILDSNGNLYSKYPAGTVPKKIVLEPGTFTLQVYTENQDSWAAANDGLGEACYFGTIQFSVEYDQVVYVNMQVPLSNYAVTLTLPYLFTDLFKSYSLNLTSGSRTVRIQESQKAYFSVADGGFTYKLEATNNDNVSHASTPITYKKVENGKLYNLTYYYGTDANSGDIDIEITDNMETEDVPVG